MKQYQDKVLLRNCWAAGTLSSLKLHAGEDVASIYKKRVVVRGMKADSYIENQPRDFLRARLGSENRCDQALGYYPWAELAYAPENFLVKIGDFYYDFPDNAVKLPDGTYLHAYGMTYKVPDKMVDWVDENDSELGLLVQQLSGGGEKDSMTFLSQGKTMRKRIISIGITYALGAHYNVERFFLQTKRIQFLDRSRSDRIDLPVVIPSDAQKQGKTIFSLGSSSYARYHAVIAAAKEFHLDPIVMYTDVEFAPDERQPLCFYNQLAHQPSFEQVIAFAKRRIAAAKRHCSTADFFVGIQDALVEYFPDEWHKVTYVLIEDKNGVVNAELSATFWVPKHFVTMVIEMQSELGNVVQMFDPLAIKDPERFFFPNLPDMYRGENTRRTIQNALIPYYIKDNYALVESSL